MGLGEGVVEGRGQEAGGVARRQQPPMMGAGVVAGAGMGTTLAKVLGQALVEGGGGGAGGGVPSKEKKTGGGSVTAGKTGSTFLECATHCAITCSTKKIDLPSSDPSKLNLLTSD